MGLVVVAAPQSASELAVMQAALEAGSVHFFVQGGGFGSLLPGPQISSFNARRIMVPDTELSAEREALVPLLQPEPDTESHRPQPSSVLRMAYEILLFGWFVPGKRGRTGERPGAASRREH